MLREPYSWLMTEPMLGTRERRAGAVPGEHIVRATLVGRFAVGHRTNDAQLVGDLRRLLQRFAEQFARDLRLNLPHLAAILDRGVGLGVERFLMGHPTREINVDQRLRRPLEIRVLLEVGLRPLQAEQVGEVQPAQTSHRAHREEAAAGKTLEMLGRATHRRLGGLVHEELAPCRQKKGSGVQTQWEQTGRVTPPFDQGRTRGAVIRRARPLGEYEPLRWEGTRLVIGSGCAWRARPRAPFRGGSSLRHLRHSSRFRTCFWKPSNTGLRLGCPITPKTATFEWSHPRVARWRAAVTNETPDRSNFRDERETSTDTSSNHASNTNLRVTHRPGGEPLHRPACNNIKVCLIEYANRGMFGRQWSTRSIFQSGEGSTVGLTRVELVATNVRTGAIRLRKNRPSGVNGGVPTPEPMTWSEGSPVAVVVLDQRRSPGLVRTILCVP